MAAPCQDCAVLFGDSITSQQYVPDSMHARFAAAYRRTLDIFNRGYGGYNTRWQVDVRARQVFDVVFAKAADAPHVPVVRLVTVWFGANDACLPGLTPDQHVPLDEYTSHLRWFLENLTDPARGYAVSLAPGLNIVLVTPPPVYPGMMDSGLAGSREPASVAAYADAVRALGAEWKSKETTKGNWRIATIDMHEAVLRAAGDDGEGLREYLTGHMAHGDEIVCTTGHLLSRSKAFGYMCSLLLRPTIHGPSDGDASQPTVGTAGHMDGLHLTTAGYGVFWDEYTRAVRTTFKGRGLDWDDADDLPLRLPAWDTIDTANPDVLAGMRLPPIRRA